MMLPESLKYYATSNEDGSTTCILLSICPANYNCHKLEVARDMASSRFESNTMFKNK
jgi:hypothetical protein